jgi:hypothetical protein
VRIRCNTLLLLLLLLQEGVLVMVVVVVVVVVVHLVWGQALRRGQAALGSCQQ